MTFNRRYILIFILIIAIVVLFLPIDVHYSFKSTAKIFPVKEWNFLRGQDDSYNSELHNYETNVLSELKNYKFERGDVAEVFLLRDFVSGDLVKAGDTIAYINSHYVDNEIIKLKNLKISEEGALSVSMAGEKQSLIEEAIQKRSFAEQQLNLEEKNYKRFKNLYNDSVISSADFDRHENSYQLAQINLEIAQKELNSIKTGVKSEEVRSIVQKIEGYQREIDSYEKLKQQYNLVSPINGLVVFNAEFDRILTVSDTSKFILKIPVKLNNVQFLDKISGIRFSIPGYTEKVDASLIDVDGSVRLFSDQQLVMAKAVISGGKAKLYPGMAVQCNVVCDKISIFSFLKRNIQLRF